MTKINKAALKTVLRVLLLLTLLSLGLFIAAGSETDQKRQNACQGCPRSTECGGGYETATCQ